MVMPALIYVAFNYQDPTTLRGWAIPAATDIAFALGALALLGRRVPIALKVFLLALAILDDLGAIINALFYTAELSLTSLDIAGVSIAILIGLNRAGGRRVALGLFVGKKLGVFGFAWLAARAGLCRLPDGISWAQIYGIALLAGVGFIMSLFIGTLAFPDPDRAAAVRLGVLSGSILSAIMGYTVLRLPTEPVAPVPGGARQPVKSHA